MMALLQEYTHNLCAGKEYLTENENNTRSLCILTAINDIITPS
jgi:hypothetical protein